MKSFLLIFAVVTTTFVYSQSGTLIGPQAEDNLRALSSRRTNNQVFTFNNRYQGVRGHPFLYNDWLMSELILANGDTVYAKAKLDVYSNEIRALTGSGDSIVVDRGLVTLLSFIDPKSNARRTFQFLAYDEIAFYELLFVGDELNLLCKRNKLLTKAVVSGTYTSGNPYDEFSEDKSSYFNMRKNSSKVTPLKLKPSSIQEVLGEESKLLLEERKLDLRKEEDLVTLVTLLDTSYE